MNQNQTNKTDYKPNHIISFFALTFVLTWSLFIPATRLPEPGQILMIILGAFGPSIAAILVVWKSKGRTGLQNWLRRIFLFRIPIHLFLSGAFLLPVGIGILQYAPYRILGGEADFSNAIPWYFYLLYLIPTALFTGGNEEPGWRGFTLPALLNWSHPVVASLILGTIHAIWHLPLMNHYDTTFGWYMFNLIPLTIIINWLYLTSQGSVLPAMMFHAGTNVISSFVPTPMDVLDGLGTYMFLRGTVYWGMAIALLIITKGRLGYDIRHDRSQTSIFPATISERGDK